MGRVWSRVLEGLGKILLSVRLKVRSQIIPFCGLLSLLQSSCRSRSLAVARFHSGRLLPSSINALHLAHSLVSSNSTGSREQRLISRSLHSQQKWCILV